jgi:glycosyltransferase involved in cell wall biosynthesis
MKILFLTTSIQEKISGGTIYNSKLFDFLSPHFEVSFEIIEDCNSYKFDKETLYIIDGILISKTLKINKLKEFSIFFLIHLWPSVIKPIDEKKRILEKLEKEICENFKLILTGENSEKHIFKTLKTRSKSIIISPGIDSNWIVKKEYSAIPKKLIYLSNFIEGKGHFKLIEAIQNLEISVDCFGEILSEKYFKLFLEKKPKNINYNGKVSHTEINSLLLKYDLLVHFSDYESFGMGILEAIATKLPIVITPVGNFEKYKSNAIQGILETFETIEIQEKLKEICTSKVKYNELIESISTYKVSSWEENFEPIIPFLHLK